MHLFRLTNFCNRVRIEAGRCRREAIVDARLLKQLLFLRALPRWLVLNLRTDHDVALLTGLTLGQRSDRHL